MPTDNLRVDGLRCEFGPVVALDGVQIEVAAGESVCIVGPNGAGKTTLLKCIAGQVPTRRGTITFSDTNVTRVPAPGRVRKGIALCPEQRRLFQGMSVADNIRLGAFSHGKRRASQCLDEMLAIFPALRDRTEQDVSTLSGGEQQMVAIARALASRPKLILLDEPTLGLAPIIVAGLFSKLKEVQRSGTSILLVEQNARAALRAADRYYVLAGGTIRQQGTVGSVNSESLSLDMYFKGGTNSDKTTTNNQIVH